MLVILQHAGHNDIEHFPIGGAEEVVNRIGGVCFWCDGDGDQRHVGAAPTVADGIREVVTAVEVGVRRVASARPENGFALKNTTKVTKKLPEDRTLLGVRALKV